MATNPTTISRPGNRSCSAALLHETYLRRLGERVRDARARRGMTRKILARDSGVSERYLAQLEGGQGNISIGLLRQVADAMNMPLADLVRDGPEAPVELALTFEFLNRLTPAQLTEARGLLVDRFGTAPGRLGRIALIGLRGAGKSTVGRLLATRLEVPFIELAREIERDCGIGLEEIFELSGQAAYRRYERRSLERVVADHDGAVIATGGGLVSEPGTYETLLNSCFTVWVQASPEAHMGRVVDQGDRRPMAGNGEAMEDLRRILRNRETLYAKADVAVDSTGRSPEQVADEIVSLVLRARAQS